VPAQTIRHWGRRSGWFGWARGCKQLLTFEQAADRPKTLAASPVIAASVVQNTRAGHQREPNATGRRGARASAAHADLGAIARCDPGWGHGMPAAEAFAQLVADEEPARGAGSEALQALHRGPHASSIRARATTRPKQKRLAIANALLRVQEEFSGPQHAERAAAAAAAIVDRRWGSRRGLTRGRGGQGLGLEAGCRSMACGTIVPVDSG